LNNCDGKDHSDLYGEDAYFDLYVEDRQPKKLVPKQECVVATRTDDGKITFSWFLFSHRSRNIYAGRECRVFHGSLVKKVGPLSQAEAAIVMPAFFTQTGNFQRWKIHEG
jgi:hypothetical protein